MQIWNPFRDSFPLYILSSHGIAAGDFGRLIFLVRDAWWTRMPVSVVYSSVVREDPCLRSCLTCPRLSASFLIFLSNAHIEKYLEMLRGLSARFLYFYERERLSILSTSTRVEKVNCRMHLNAFSEDPKFHYAAISDRYLINRALISRWAVGDIIQRQTMLWLQLL